MNFTLSAHLDIDDIFSNITLSDCDLMADASPDQLSKSIGHHVRHNLSKVCLMDTINLNAEKPQSRYRINKALTKYHNHTFHFYVMCAGCEQYQCFESSAKRRECPNCKCDTKLSETNFFIHIPLKQQLLSSLRMYYKEIIAYAEEMVTKNTMCDVQQGMIHKEVRARCPDDTLLLSLVLNTDGVKMFDHSTFSLWPILMYQNFLPPKIRYSPQNILVAGLWYGRSTDVDFLSYFRPICEELRILKNGFSLRIDNRELKAIIAVTHCAADLPAKAKMLNMVNFNAYYSCSFCLSKGDAVQNRDTKTATVRHLFRDNTPEKRDSTITIQTMLDMSERNGDAVSGIKGISPLVGFENLDLIRSFGVDYLHAVLLGLTKKFRKLWCCPKNSKTDYYLSKKKQEVLNKRFANIRPPSYLQRRPTCFDSVDKGVEFRALLLFYLPVSLHGLLRCKYVDHFNLFSSSVFTLLQINITEDELRKCEDDLRKFVQDFQVLYGQNNVTHNVHLMLHVVDGVRNLGPLWAQSTFGFESFNGFLARSVKGPTKILHQITEKYLLYRSHCEENKKIDTERNTLCHVLGKGKKATLDLREKSALLQFLSTEEERPFLIHHRINRHDIIYTSVSYKRAVKTIDFFLEFSDKIIGKAMFYFIHDSKISVLIEKFERKGKITDHILEVYSSGTLIVKNEMEISRKLIYMEIEKSLQKKNYVSYIPNHYD